MTDRATGTLWRGSACLALSAWLLGLAPSAAQTSAEAPPASGLETVSWPIEPAERHTPRPARLADAVERIGSLEGVYSVLVAHRGTLVVERYFRDGFREKPHNLKSASKSVLSALVGIAVAEGLLELDRPIVEILPGPVTLDDPRKAAITVRHLLTMTSGLESTSYETYGEWTAGRDWARGALALRLVAAPGSRFQYSTGNSHLLSTVLAAATGMSTREFAESRLFGPLGVEIKGWARDPSGVHIGGNDLSLTPRDMARFGQLFLDGGRARDRQVVPAEWVAESTRTGEIGRHDVYGTYGYLWWTDLVYEGAFTAAGFGGQYVYVSPPHDCVVVVTSTLISKGEQWTAELFELLRHGVLASFEPAASYYARAGRPPVDPAIESLERAVARAQTEIAALRDVAETDGPALPGHGRTTTRVNLRQGPDTATARLRLLERGVAVELLERADGWLRARVDGEVGWIRADFLLVENGSWRPLATTLRHDLAAFSEAIRDRLPEEVVMPASPSGPAAPTARDRRAEELERRLAASIADRGEALSGARAVGLQLSGELDKARQHIQLLESQLTAGSGEQQAAAAELENARLRIAALTAVEEGRAAQGRELAEARERVEALRQALAAADAGRVELAAELERQSAAATRGAAQRAATREQMTAELAAAHERIAGLEESLVRAQAAQFDLADRLKLLGDEKAQLRQGMALAAESRGALDDELAAARIRIAGLEQTLNASNAELGELEEQFAGLTDEEARRRESLRGAAESRQALSGELELARDRIADLEDSLAAAQTGHNDLAAAQGRIASLERQLSDAGEVLRSLEARLALEEAEAARELALGAAAQGEVSGQLEAAGARIAELDKNLSAAAQRNDGLEARLAELQRQAAARGAALEQAQSGQGELASRLEAADGKIAGLEDQLRTAQRDRSRLMAEVAALGARGGRSSEQSAALGTKLRTADARIQALEGQLRAADGANLRLNDSLKALRAEWEERTLELAEATRSRDALGSRQEAAHRRIEELEKRLERGGEQRAVLSRRLEVAERRAAASDEAVRQADASRAAMAAEVVAARQEAAAQLAAAVGQIAALEQRIAGLEERPAALRVADEAPAQAPARTVAADDRAVATALVRDWASAWSRQDPERYLAFYASSFEPSDGLSREAWANRRRELLRRPEFIEVEVSSVEVELQAGGERARVAFRQVYRTESRRLTTLKALDLVREHGAWRIQRERVAG